MLFPGQFHSLQIWTYGIHPVLSGYSWLSLCGVRFPVYSLLQQPAIILTQDMPKSPRSSFLDTNSNCCSVLCYTDDKQTQWSKSEQAECCPLPCPFPFSFLSFGDVHKWRHALLGYNGSPPPLSHIVTPAWTPFLPFECNVIYGSPLSFPLLLLRSSLLSSFPFSSLISRPLKVGP